MLARIFDCSSYANAILMLVRPLFQDKIMPSAREIPGILILFMYKSQNVQYMRPVATKALVRGVGTEYFSFSAHIMAKT